MSYFNIFVKIKQKKDHGIAPWLFEHLVFFTCGELSGRAGRNKGRFPIDPLSGPREAGAFRGAFQGGIRGKWFRSCSSGQFHVVRCNFSVEEYCGWLRGILVWYQRKPHPPEQPARLLPEHQHGMSRRQQQSVRPELPGKPE